MATPISPNQCIWEVSIFLLLGLIIEIIKLPPNGGALYHGRRPDPSVEVTLKATL